jgi:hypothetical protein
MLEAVEELISLLETEKRLLGEGRPIPAELLERLRIAGDGVTEILTDLRQTETVEPSPDLRILKTRLQERFVFAFQLTRETEQLMAAKPTASVPNRGGVEKTRLSLSEVERQYRSRMGRK